LVAVNNVDLDVTRGEVLGIVGESGSGKTVLGLSSMGLIDRPGRVAAGQVVFDGQDVTNYPESGWRNIRGKRIAMIFQDPTTSLNPVQRIGAQMIEALQSHRDISGMPLGKSSAMLWYVSALTVRMSVWMPIRTSSPEA
jgi:peptide/nickel transport system ATP-binding protein